MHASKRQATPPTEAERVIAWRVSLLVDAGCPATLAQTLASDSRYDLHELLELIDRGCPAELAARILAPLEDAVA
jgi:hypothetical protein